MAKADEGYDVVGTVRQNRQDSWFRKTASKMINRLIQRTTGKAMGDYGCMLRAYRRHIVDAMLHCHERSTFIPILANIFARRAIEIPVHHAEREFGESKYSFMRLINLMYDLVTCLTTTPLRMLSLLGSIIAIGGFSIAVLLVISVFIISNTIKLTTFDRRDEIAIMKMVGATNGFIRLPFVVEGFSLGMIGAILAFGLEWLGYDAMIAKIGSVDALQLFNFVPFQELLLPMVATFAAAGMFVGIVGSWTSIRKFMDV